MRDPRLPGRFEGERRLCSHDRPSVAARACRSDPAFMEEMQKAMSDPNLMASIAGLAGVPSGAGAGSDDEDDE